MLKYKHRTTNKLVVASVFTFSITLKMAQLSNYDFRFAKNHLRSFTYIQLGD